MVIRNTDGLTAIGNRYLGSKNATDVARAYSRTERKEISVQTDVYAGNRQSDQLTVVQNGIEEKIYDPLPKLSPEIYTRTRNVLDRMFTIASTVFTSGAELSSNERAIYDAEFQSLRQRLVDDHIGSNPTAAGVDNPANVKLENVQLLESDEKVITVADAEKALTHVVAAQGIVNTQEGGYQADQLDRVSVARQTFFRYDNSFGAAAAQIEQFRSDYNRMQTDPTVQMRGQFNSRTSQSFNKSSLISLLV